MVDVTFGVVPGVVISVVHLFRFMSHDNGPSHGVMDRKSLKTLMNYGTLSESEIHYVVMTFSLKSDDVIRQNRFRLSFQFALFLNYE